MANHDPANRGGVRVALYWQGGRPLLWAPVASAHASAGFGLMTTPEVGDEVLVGFLDSDTERPVVLGSVWNGVHAGPRERYEGEHEAELAGNHVKRIVTKSGIRVHLVDTPSHESITVATPRSNRLVMTEHAEATGRPAVVLHTEGDIRFEAGGRVHRVAQLESHEVAPVNSLAGLSCAQKMESALKGAPWSQGVLDALGGAKGVAALVAGAVALQFVPIAGELEDAVLIVGTVLARGNILKGLKQLKQFHDFCCGQAQTEVDFNQAGRMAADAMATIGVNGALALLPFVSKGVRGTRAS